MDYTMNTMSYKRYTAKIEFDPEDKILFGNLIGICDTMGFHGETVPELIQAFHEVEMAQQLLDLQTRTA